MTKPKRFEVGDRVSVEFAKAWSCSPNQRRIVQCEIFQGKGTVMHLLDGAIGVLLDNGEFEALTPRQCKRLKKVKPREWRLQDGQFVGVTTTETIMRAIGPPLAPGETVTVREVRPKRGP